MDNYITMCDASIELKKCWKPTPGDRFYVKNPLYVIDEKFSVIKGDKNLPYYGEGIHYVSDFEGFGYIDIGGDEFTYDMVNLRLHSIWIPYQEQLQKLLKRKFITNSSLFTAFGAFATKQRYGRLIRDYDLDQIWLCFYMFETHDKMWDGERWVKVDKSNLMGSVWS